MDFSTMHFDCFSYRSESSVLNHVAYLFPKQGKKEEWGSSSKVAAGP